MVKPTSSKAKKQGPSKKEIRKKTRKELRKIRSAINQLGKPEDLKKIRILLSKGNLDVEAIQAWTTLKPLLDKENMPVKEFENALKVLEKHEITLSSFISLIEKAEMLRAKYGKPYTALIKDYESEVEKLAKASASLKETEDAKKGVEGRISQLRDLEVLQGVLAENGVPVDEITQYLEQHKRLGQFGFDVNTVKIIAEELKRLQIDPQEAGKTVGSWLTKNKTIGEALRKVEGELEESRKEEALTIARLKSLEQKALEAQKKIDALESYYIRRSESLDSEYENIEHALVVRVGEERNRAEAELSDILRDRDRLRSENRVLKEEVEAIRKEVELVRSISILIRDPKAVSTSQLDTLVSEFMKAKEAMGREDAGSSSSERLIEARRILVSALRDSIELAK